MWGKRQHEVSISKSEARKYMFVYQHEPDRIRKIIENKFDNRNEPSRTGAFTPPSKTNSSTQIYVDQSFCKENVCREVQDKIWSIHFGYCRKCLFIYLYVYLLKSEMDLYVFIIYS